MAEMLFATYKSDDTKITEVVTLKTVIEYHFMCRVKYRRIRAGLFSTVLKYGIISLNP